MAVSKTNTQGLFTSVSLGPAPAKVSGKTLLILAGLGVGGYLLYKHFHKGGTVELAGTEPVDVDDDADGED